jgi:hypothetical protein
MKTAILVNDELLEDTDRAAREMGLSRSRVVSMALEWWLRERRQKELLKQLNEVCAVDPDPAERRTTQRIKAKFREIITDRW